MAIDLKRRGFASEVLGVESDPVNASAALKIGLVDRLADFENSKDYIIKNVARICNKYPLYND
mgnify:CR=1 FL=1